VDPFVTQHPIDVLFLFLWKLWKKVVFFWHFDDISTFNFSAYPGTEALTAKRNKVIDVMSQNFSTNCVITEALSTRDLQIFPNIFTQSSTN